MDLKLILEQTAQRCPEKTAIVSGERRVSYAELDRASNKLANSLIQMGVRKGDRVAAMLTNSPEYAIVYFGITKTGGIAVPLDTRYKIEELSTLFASCRPKVLITEDPFSGLLGPALSQFPSVEHFINLGPGDNRQFLSYREIVSAGSDKKVNIDLAPNDIAVINYTSGPSTDPHGAMLSHYSLVTDATMSGEAFQQTEQDVVMLFALPIYHQFGLTTVLLCSINKGSTIVMVPGTGISINSLMEAIEREKGTMFLGVPYIFALAAKMAKREGIKNDLSSLRLCISGGAPLPISVIRQFEKYYGSTIVDIWGLTEATSHVTSPPLNGPIKLGAAGKAMPGWELKIVDDEGNELPPNQQGEIIIKGPIISGYYNNPQATAETIKNGWLYTGDIGRVDEDGYLFITGRKKKMIILKGQNVYPNEVEQILLTHPKIAATKVIGMPDRLRGEVVSAIVALKPGEIATEQEIRHFCQERMADYKSPKQVIFVDSIPQAVPTKHGEKIIRHYLTKLSRMTRSRYHGIEEVLCTHPKVAEAKVVGIPDKLRGEIIKAIIRLKEGEKVTKEEIRRFCRERMANYKFLKQITFTKAKL